MRMRRCPVHEADVAALVQYRRGFPAQGCKEFNTSFIERLNGTFRERLASDTHANVAMQRRV
jgi:hypothetical protein